MSYKQQYLKYKLKYLELKNELEGGAGSLEYEDLIKIEKNLEQKQRKINLGQVKYLQEQERQRRIRQNSDIIERGTDISQLQEEERQMRLDTVYIESENEVIPIYNSNLLNKMFEDLPSIVKKMRYDDFIQNIPKIYSNINIKDLLNTISEIRRLYKSEDGQSAQMVILNYGITTILLLIAICDFLEINDIYNNLIKYIEWYIMFRYPRNLSLEKGISIYEIVEVINNVFFIRNNLNININSDILTKILITRFIPPANILSELYQNMINGRDRKQNYKILRLVFHNFVQRILEYNIKDEEKIINYFESFSSYSSIDKIRFLLNHDIS
jgi:hypothetical protein